MKAIHSRTTSERIVRTTLIVLVVSGFAVAFLHDGYVGYARTNARDLARTLGADPDPLPVIDWDLTENSTRKTADQLVGLRLTAPGLRDIGTPSLERDNARYYLGPGGYLRVQIEGGVVTAAAWSDGTHNESDQLWQVWIGYTLAGFGVLAVFQFARVVTTRVSLTQAGLKVRGKPLIPFAAITSVATTKSQRGVIQAATIHHVLGDRSRALRLDSYVVKELPAILQAIESQRQSIGTVDRSINASDGSATEAVVDPTTPR